MIRVLVVDDSPTIRALLTQLLESDAGIRVVGSAADGEAAVQQALALRPNLITMDIRMPRMDGFEATRRIMEVQPTPIIVVSASVEAPDLRITFNAMSAGALDVIEKPSGGSPDDLVSLRDKLVRTVKLMAEVKVVRRRPARLTGALELPASGRSFVSPAVVVIGASTGGPAALNTVLRQLPADFRLPVVVVQHMAAGFTQGLVDWLRLDSRLPVRVARHGQHLANGEVYFAEEGQHLVFLERGVLGRDSSPPVSHVRPSATVLFRSAAATYGAEALGVLLTGMGDDGAQGLLAIRDKGGLTLAQDAATSVVYGMPRVAAELGAARYVLALEKIAPTLAQLAR